MDITNKPAFIRRYKIQPETNEPVETKRLTQVMQIIYLCNHLFLKYNSINFIFVIGYHECIF